MKRIIYSLFIALGLVAASSCDLDLLEDPNNVSPSTASPNLVLNRIQLDFAAFFNTTGNHGMRITRMLTLGNNLYEQAYVPVTFNGMWTQSYANILNNIKLLLPLAEESNFRRHAGIARTLRAYTLMTLVDHFGDVPWSEALDPNNFSPKIDQGASIYEAALADLQAAKADFQAQSVGTPTDFFYNNNAQRWLRLIATLELKYHLNRSLIDQGGSTSAINALISAANFIGPGDDFVFRYGQNQTDPDSRHPRFTGSYIAGGGDYQATWYMFQLTEAKGFDDPRARYYLYRQRLANPTDPDELRCISEFAPSHYQTGSFPFCLPGTRGYWGRDHLNAEGIPPDGLARTVWGLYPAGGRYDNNSGQPVNNPQLGNRGAGIQPIMLSAFVDFMLAEAVVRLGANGNAKELLLSGIGKHMGYVRAFAMGSSEAAAINAFEASANGSPWDAAVAAYTAFVSGQYDGAGNTQARMRVIGREYWLSLYGNGIEAYNLYRRTGMPDNMQPALINPTGGVFPRSFLYPNDFVVTNKNAEQKPGLNVKVFWDNNPDGFIY